MRLIVVLAVVGLAMGSGQRSANLVADPGAEQIKSGEPVHWKPLTIGARCEFSVDSTIRHSGDRSLRIDAKETARSYWQSDPIPVAPGETIRGGAWVRVRNVPAGKGTVIAIAEFTDARGLNLQVAKFNTAAIGPDGGDENWQNVEGTLKVPAGASQLRLRLGFSYCQGTCWWDDAYVSAEQQVVARIDLDSERLSPARDAIRITILNRSGLQGKARIELSLGKDTVEAPIMLNGDALQQIDVPCKIASRGRQSLAARLFLSGSEKAAFVDERSVTIPAPMVLQPPSPTHWAVEDGRPTIEGEVDLALPRETTDGASLVVKLEDARSRVLGQSAPIQKIVDAWNRYKLDLPTLPVGDYTLVAELTSRDGKVIRAEQPWHVIPRERARVTLNADGFPVCDGKAIYPLGVFNGGAKMKEMGQAGFTVAHAYNAANAEFGQPPDDAGLKRFLDSAGENGMKVCLLIPRGIVFHGDWDNFRRRVRMFRNHPAVLCWDEEEGIARGDMPPDYLVKLRQIVREEDPNHPLMVGDARDIIGRVTDRSNFFPVDQMDLGMWWWYPLPLKTGASNALEGEEATTRPELVPPQFLVQRNTEKPIWVGVQAYKKKNSRYPTPAEQRAQAYIAIIHGAKGLMWYGGSVTGGAFLAPEEAHWDEIKKLARELLDLSPILMARNEDPPKFEPADAPISICLKRANGRNVLFVVNRGLVQVQVKLSLPSQLSGAADVISEARTVPVKHGVITDSFEPLGVHVYDLPEAR